LPTPISQYISSLLSHNIAKVLLAARLGAAEQTLRQVLSDDAGLRIPALQTTGPAMQETAAPAKIDIELRRLYRARLRNLETTGMANEVQSTPAKADHPKQDFLNASPGFPICLRVLVVVAIIAAASTGGRAASSKAPTMRRSMVTSTPSARASADTSSRSMSREGQFVKAGTVNS